MSKYPLTRDIPMVNIFDVTPDQVRQQWHKIPDHFKVSESAPASDLQVNFKKRSSNRHLAQYAEHN